MIRSEAGRRPGGASRSGGDTGADSNSEKSIRIAPVSEAGDCPSTCGNLKPQSLQKAPSRAVPHLMQNFITIAGPDLHIRRCCVASRR